MPGKNEGEGRRWHQRMKWLEGITDAMDTDSEQTLRNGEGQGGLPRCTLCQGYLTKSQAPLGDEQQLPLKSF